MDWDTAEAYWLAITQIEAQEILLRFRVGDYPHMKKEERRKTHRQFVRLAYPADLDGDKMSTEQLAKKLKAALNV